MREKQYDALKEERDILKDDLNSTHLSKEELIKKVSWAQPVSGRHLSAERLTRARPGV